jgi:hypothetical protein
MVSTGRYENQQTVLDETAGASQLRPVLLSVSSLGSVEFSMPNLNRFWNFWSTVNTDLEIAFMQSMSCTFDLPVRKCLWNLQISDFLIEPTLAKWPILKSKWLHAFKNVNVLHGKYWKPFWKFPHFVIYLKK